jgi:hypothetical protein
MKPTSIALVLGLAVATASLTSCASGNQARTSLWSKSGMEIVANTAPSGEPGHRWRYFCDTREGRAVVISPGGDYFYSDGDGLTRVYQASTQRATS